MYSSYTLYNLNIIEYYNLNIIENYWILLNIIDIDTPYTTHMYSSYTTWILDINIFQTLMVFPGLYDVRKRLSRKETFSYDFSAAVESWCIFKWKWIETIGRFVSWGEAGGDTELWIDWFANAAGSETSVSIFLFINYKYKCRVWR